MDARDRSERPRRFSGRRILLAGSIGVPASIVLVCWLLTAEVESVGPSDFAPIAVVVDAPRRPEWPVERLEGEPAKQLLLETLKLAEARLDRVAGYTALFRKQERIGGSLLPEQSLDMKVRHAPFAIYLKFLKPKAGKEVVYAEGYNDNKVIAHNGDWTRRLLPRLAVDPSSPLALADSKRPITEAGLAKLTKKLIGFREMDLTDAHAETILDRIVDDAGRERLRSVHRHSRRSEQRPFIRVQVLYEPETFIPVAMEGYEWPEEGRPGDPELGERYVYENLVLDAPLTAMDFDPTNPNYSFHRY